MTSGAHASARETVEKYWRENFWIEEPGNLKDEMVVMLEAYGQAVERETRERCAKSIEAVTRDWRELAALWAEQEATSYWPSVKGVEQPPGKARSTIANWVNWLRKCADQVELAIRGEGA